MFIRGVGMTKFGIHERASHELSYEAIQEALADAEMSIDEIDAIVISKGDSVNDRERQRLFPAIMSSILRRKNIPIMRVTSACSGGGSAMWNAVHMGYDNVLVLGVDKLSEPPTKYVTDDLMMASDRIYEQTEGMSFPVQNALIAQQYMRKYGVKESDLTKVSVKNHAHACLNPKARFYGKVVTEKMVKKSPVIASPLRLFDCSVSIDGAAAAIVSTKETDVEIKASALMTDRLPAFEAADMTSWNATVMSANEAYQQAGITPADLDIVELHDAFTSVELMAYEDLGLAKRGKGKDLIRKGATHLSGDRPVNTSGGLKAKGHPISATGVSQIVEVVEQMRGRADKRQLDKTTWGLAHNVGGVGSTVTCHILKHRGG